MVSLPTLLEFIEETLIGAWDALTDSVDLFLSSLLDSFVAFAQALGKWPLVGIQPANAVLLHIETLVERFLFDVLQAPFVGAVNTIQTLIVENYDPKWKTQVVRRDRAIDDGLTICTDFVMQAAQLKLPISVSLSLQVKSIKSKISLLAGKLPTLVKVVGGIAVKIVFFIIQLLLSFIFFIGAFISVCCAWNLVRKLIDNTIFQPLSQSAPRLKWLGLRPGNKDLTVIARRDPGGVSP